MGIEMQAGDEIQNLCTKCGVVAHVVVAIADGSVAKVECKECGSNHRLRDASKKKTKATGTTSRSRAARTEQLEPSVEPDLTRPIRPYQTSDTYTVGDRIDHLSFGTGVIERVIGPSKVQVFFSAGQKMLLHGKMR